MMRTTWSATMMVSTAGATVLLVHSGGGLGGGCGCSGGPLTNKNEQPLSDPHNRINRVTFMRSLKRWHPFIAVVTLCLICGPQHLLAAHAPHALGGDDHLIEDQSAHRVVGDVVLRPERVEPQVGGVALLQIEDRIGRRRIVGA